MNSTLFGDDPVAQQILLERAQILARQEMLQEEGRGEEILQFRLDTGTYGMPAHFVSEIQVLESYTPLPATPSFVLGLVNIRGRLLTVLDLRPLLGIARRPPESNAFLVVINVNGVEVGLLADMVTGVQNGEVSLTPALSATSGHPVPWVRGLDQHLTLHIDPVQLMADKRLIVADGTDQKNEGRSKG